MYEKQSERATDSHQVAVDLDSPDGQWTAGFVREHELGQGGPALGKLRLWPSTAKELALEVCPDPTSSRMLWSSCSRYLAFLRWLGGNRMQLCVLEVSTRNVRSLRVNNGLPRLSSFESGQLITDDHPPHNPDRFEYDATRASTREDEERPAES